MLKHDGRPHHYEVTPPITSNLQQNVTPKACQLALTSINDFGKLRLTSHLGILLKTAIRLLPGRHVMAVYFAGRTLTRRSKDLGPIDDRVACRVNGIRRAHFRESFFHDICAVAGA